MMNLLRLFQEKTRFMIQLEYATKILSQYNEISLQSRNHQLVKKTFLGRGQKEPRVDDDQLPERTAKRRRQYEPHDKLIERYKRRPSISTFNYRQYMLDPPVNIRAVQRMNQIWMILCFLCKDTPMWRAWNFHVHTDKLPQQVIGYMENIELPPTRLDVVQETLRRSQKLASECGDRYTIVHYDLAIAKPALQSSRDTKIRQCVHLVWHISHHDDVFCFFGVHCGVLRWP